MIVEINGDKYALKQQPERSAMPMSKYIMELVILGGMMGGFDKPKERPKVDIVEEFKLIQNKQSKLSRSERDWVVREFNKNFIKVI